MTAGRHITISYALTVHNFKQDTKARKRKRKKERTEARREESKEESGIKEWARPERCTHYPKTYETPQNSDSQKRDMKKILF